MQEESCASTVATAAPADIHMEQENENRIQNDVDDGADERGHHAQHRVSLCGDEIVHSHGKQGEKGAAGINGQIGVRIGEGGVARSEPAKQQILGEKEQDGEHGRTE